MHIFLNVGDCGPDQAGLRGSLQTQFAADAYEFMLLFCLGCMKHQFHLIARGQLSLVDVVLKQLGKDYKYFTSVATMSHTWRGHLKKVRAAWGDLHRGDERHINKKILFRTPPVAIAGRWASID